LLRAHALTLLFVVGSLGEEDGAEIAIAEAMDSRSRRVDALKNLCKRKRF
jgi:hypothetical protein